MTQPIEPHRRGGSIPKLGILGRFAMRQGIKTLASTWKPLLPLRLRKLSKPRLSLSKFVTIPRLSALNRATTRKQDLVAKVLTELSRPQRRVRRFNALAGGMKKQDNWELALLDHVEGLDDGERLRLVASLAKMPLRALRSLDRAVLRAAYTAVYQHAGTHRDTLEQAFQEVMNTEIIEGADMTPLGSGAVNTVYEIRREGQASVVFKPDPTAMSFGTRLRETLFGTAKRSGIPVGSRAHLAHRAVATAITDRAFFGDEGVTVNTRFAVVDGMQGILMDLATGVDIEAVKEVEVELNPGQAAQLDLLLTGRRPTKRRLRQAAIQMGFRDIRRVDGVYTGVKSVLSYGEDKTMNLRRGTTAEGLLKAQLLDIVTGQVDRHPGNYRIDPETGAVKVIDDDCSFGVHAMPRHRDVRRQSGIVPNNGSLMLRMPKVLTRGLKRKVLLLLANWSKGLHLERQLAPHMSPEELSAARDRLERLAAYVRSDACRKVDSAEDLVNEKYLSLCSPEDCYLLRDELIFNPQASSLNHLRRPFFSRIQQEGV